MVMALKVVKEVSKQTLCRTRVFRGVDRNLVAGLLWEQVVYPL